MADEGYITTAEADAAKKRPIVDARPAGAAAVDRAVLPRDRFATQLEERYGAKAAVRERPRRQDRPRSRAAARRQPRARRRACGGSTSCAASESPRATCSPRSARSRPTGIRAGRAIPSTATSCRRSSWASKAPTFASASAASPARSAEPATRGPTKAGSDLVHAGDLVEVARRQDRRDGGDVRRRRSSSRRLLEGAVRRDREPHRPDPGDGRRRELRAQPVQPRDAGDAPGRLALQAVRLHGRHRPRLHGAVAARRLAGELRRRARASRRTSRRTTTTSITGTITLREALEGSRNVPDRRV